MKNRRFYRLKRFLPTTRWNRKKNTNYDMAVWNKGKVCISMVASWSTDSNRRSNCLWSDLKGFIMKVLKVANSKAMFEIPDVLSVSLSDWFILLSNKVDILLIDFCSTSILCARSNECVQMYLKRIIYPGKALKQVTFTSPVWLTWN